MVEMPANSMPKPIKYFIVSKNIHLAPLAISYQNEAFNIVYPQKSHFTISTTPFWYSGCRFSRLVGTLPNEASSRIAFTLYEEPIPPFMDQ